MERSGYLTKKMVMKTHVEQRRVVVLWASQYRATHRNVRHPHGKQEEADTKLIVHASEATDSGV